MRAAKAINLVNLAESNEDYIRGANINIDGGRNTPKAVEDAKSSK